MRYTESMSPNDFVPEYLRPFIAKQDASLYTPIDHASWRFILRISKSFFSGNAHQKYLSGLEQTGIHAERIPLIEEMDEKLRKHGWRAVAVSGFIPPAVFMEFQSLGILPIACEMRTLEHLAYTPAPDIVHEAAGHAPIIADPEYAQYLRNYGEVARKAIFSSQDMAVYEAVRNLSVVKEDPESGTDDIARAQKRLDEAGAAVTYVSEATLLARMNWWTVEYGLVGSLENPKIYGAGLLSSVGESFACLGPKVRRVPLTVDCVNTVYDITKPQPQLFVTPDFHHLTDVLRDFEKTMAFRLGGSAGLAKALQASTVCTYAFDSGIQVSGVLADFRFAGGSSGAGATDEVAYLRCAGPTQLACGDREIAGQGPEYHREGFSTLLGKLKDGRSPAALSDADWRALGRRIEYASGFVVEGELKKIHREGGRALIATFEKCTVSRAGEIFFKPEWGSFDLALGDRVASVFGGAADRAAYLAKTGGFKQSPMAPKCNLTPENRDLAALYAKVRSARERGVAGEALASELNAVGAELDADHPNDWLLRLEILELAKKHDLSLPLSARLFSRLKSISGMDAATASMIQRGIEVL